MHNALTAVFAFALATSTLGACAVDDAPDTSVIQRSLSVGCLAISYDSSSNQLTVSNLDSGESDAVELQWSHDDATRQYESDASVTEEQLRIHYQSLAEAYLPEISSCE